MKNIGSVIFSVCLLGIVGCSNADDMTGYSLVEEIILTTVPAAEVMGEDMDDNGNTTRSGWGLTGSTAYPLFEGGDTAGIFPSGGYQIPFVVPGNKGELNKTVSIEAQGWMTKDSLYYAVYLPYDFYNRYYNKIPWDYSKTVIQKENNTFDHIGEQMFMVSDTTLADSGKFFAVMRYMGAVLKVNCKMPIGGIFKKFVLASSDSKQFAADGTMNIFSPSHEFLANAYTDYLTLYLDDISLEGNGVLRVYVMMPPNDFQNKRLTVYIWDQYGNCYSGYRDLGTGYVYNENSYGSINITNIVVVPSPQVYEQPYQSEMSISGVAIE